MMMISSFAPSGATAQGILNHWLPPGEGDVYDAASWDQVSTDPVSGEFLLDDVRIENGGTAIAERTSPLRTDTGDELEVATLQVGSRVATTDPTESRGTLRLDDLDLRVLGDIHVGDDRWAATTYGVLNVQGGANAAGHVVLDGDFDRRLDARARRDGCARPRSARTCTARPRSRGPHDERAWRFRLADLSAAPSRTGCARGRRGRERVRSDPHLGDGGRVRRRDGRRMDSRRGRGHLREPRRR
ncbi:MAG: hypothetical protein R3E53_13150 [Myxococcota bacterium]